VKDIVRLSAPDILHSLGRSRSGCCCSKADAALQSRACRSWGEALSSYQDIDLAETGWAILLRSVRDLAVSSCQETASPIVASGPAPSARRAIEEASFRSTGARDDAGW